MVDKIIPPRRDEILSDKGLGTRRFLDYLERTATQVNDSTSLTEGDLASISMLSAQLAAINKRIDSIANEILSNNKNSKTDKKVTALENDFIAPFYKTKYDKLMIKIANIDNATINEKLKLTLDNDAADPTVQFGDGDTGFYEESDDVLAVALAGSKGFSFSPTALLTPNGTWNGAGINIETGDIYKINNVSILSATFLGSSVLSSSLTSLGVIASLVATTADINDGTVEAVIGATTPKAATFTTANSNSYAVAGIQVVSNQGAAVSDATGGATIDAEARTAINDLLARVRSHGLIA